MPENVLVDRLKAGDVAAYETLVQANAGKMLSVARRVLRNDQDAEDATQEALLAAWKAIGSFDGRSTITTWLHRITVNSSLAILRKRRPRLQESLEDLETNIRSADGPMTEFQQNEIKQLVWGAIEQLAEDQRLVLILRDVEEMSSKQVAEALGVADSAVRQRLHRARQFVAELLWPELCGARQLTCGGELGLLLDYLDRLLDELSKEFVGKHVLTCAACTNLSEKYSASIGMPKQTASVAGAAAERRLIDRILREVGLR